MVVDVDPQPVHVPAAGDFLGSDHRDVVLRLAGDDAGVAADANGGIDHHRPGVAAIGRWPLRQLAGFCLLACRRPLCRLGEIVQGVKLTHVFRGAHHVLGG